MNKLIKRLFIALCFVFISGSVYSQDDPLIPQSFAVDTRSKVMAVIDDTQSDR